jgi:hypothetical protein
MPTTERNHHRLSIAIGAVSCALTIAACGNSSPQATVGGATTATGNASPIALSRCMRSNGVPNFPDPTMGPGGEGFRGLLRSPDGSLTVDNIPFSGPALRAAETACKRYLVPTGPPPKISAGEKQAALANAQCIRKHGVPNFPDPTFPSGGGSQISLGPGVNARSPAFQAAAKACGGPGNHVLRDRLPAP